MAKTFVIRDDLLNESPTNPVRVVSYYPDSSTLDIASQGAECTMLTLADSLVQSDPVVYLKTLIPNWRDDYKPVINAEVTRRINLVFPEFKQRNYTAQYQDYITTYGADPASWPADAVSFKAEYDRGWTYISDMRTASNSWTSMPADPTADAIWPAPITPIK